MQRSMLRQMLAVVSHPGILSFAGGLPAPELFPAAEYGQAVAKVLSADAKALQYGPPYQPLKAHIVTLMAQRGVTCSEEQVFITTGAQQALDVLTRFFLDPGGDVVLEEVVYTGIQQAVAPMRPCIWPISTDLETGMNVDEIEEQLATGMRPAYIYAIPDAHNPLGVSISPAKRQQLVDLAAADGIPIIEDDPYGFLCYDGRSQPPLRALNDEWVFYVGSFSKLLAPALRLGWMIVPEALVPKVTVIKEAGDLESSALTQRAVAAYLETGHFPQHLQRLCEEYGRRRDTMLSALDHYFPSEATWTRPAAGMFVWVTLPEEVDTTELLSVAVEQEKVAFIPGQAFAVAGCQARNCMRLNFSNCCLPDIEEGIGRLGNLLHQYL
jgi:2-aminoadipate transaminase